MQFRSAFKAIVLLTILAVAVAVPYFITGRNGKPLIMIDGGLAGGTNDESRDVYYKWQDEKGQWHFGDEVPAGVTPVAVSVDINTNVIQGIKAVGQEAAEEAEEEENMEKTQGTGMSSGLPMTINPASVPALLQDAGQVQQLLDQRADRLEQALER